MTKKRDIFTELTEGFDGLKSEREGKLTLRTFKVESKPAPVLLPVAAAAAAAAEASAFPLFCLLPPAAAAAAPLPAATLPLDPPLLCLPPAC